MIPILMIPTVWYTHDFPPPVPLTSNVGIMGNLRQDCGLIHPILIIFDTISSWNGYGLCPNEYCIASVTIESNSFVSSIEFVTSFVISFVAIANVSSKCFCPLLMTVLLCHFYNPIKVFLIIIECLY